MVAMEKEIAGGGIVRGRGGRKVGRGGGGGGRGGGEEEEECKGEVDESRYRQVVAVQLRQMAPRVG